MRKKRGLRVPRVASGRERSSRARGFELRGLKEIGYPLADRQPLCRECGSPMERHLPRSDAIESAWRCRCGYVIAVGWSDGFFNGEEFEREWH